MWLAALVPAGLAASGCAYLPNHFKEEGPSVTMSWESPSSADIKSQYTEAEMRHRDWQASRISPESGAVAHMPVYFVDPFIDEGAARTDETDPHNVYRGSWVDYVAAPYGLAQFTGNWLLFPASAVITPPWTIMESDGEISKRMLWYDLDARRTKHTIFHPAPSTQPANPEETPRPGEAVTPPDTGEEPPPPPPVSR